MDQNVPFGRRLRRLRKARDLTQAALAQQVYCAINTIQKIEAGVRRPSRELAVLFADCLSLADAERTAFLQAARTEVSQSRLDISPLPIKASSQHNLPSQPTALIGREREITAVRDLLRQPDVRLVTLTGPGGIGKTRLGLQVATELLDDFRDGVWFINLAPLVGSALVMSAIAQVLGVEETGSLPLLERLKAYLRTKQVLLLLDNFEHVLAAAPSVADLLATCPHLKVLATSREVLHLRGEHEAVVRALALPDPMRPAPLEQLIQYAAIQLFIACAQAAQADFALTNADASVVTEICARLDGLPLAIELAAVWIKLLSPQTLITQLDKRLKLLTHGPQDAPVRQQSLRNTLAWSYDLLGADEQTLFQRLGVFVGGFTLEAATDVVHFEFKSMNEDAGQLKTQNSELNTLEGLAALVDKSLVRQTAGTDGESRFTMLETIREYALERLAERGEAEAVRHRHVQFFLSFAEMIEPQLYGSTQEAGLTRLEIEYDNLRAALAWAVDHDTAGALRLVGALTDFWHFRSHLSEGRHWLERVIAVTDSWEHDNIKIGAASDTGLSMSARVKALHGAGMLAHSQEDDVRAEALYAMSLTLAQSQGDQHRVAMLLNDLGEMALHRSDTQRALNLHHEALEIARTLGDQRVIAQLLVGLGDVLRVTGDHEAATAYLGESLAIRQRLGDQRGVAWALHALGLVAQASGAYHRALELLTEALTHARMIGDKENMVWLLYDLGGVSLKEHDLASAAMQFGESARRASGLGLRLAVALNLDGLATVRIQQQALVQAVRLLRVADAHWKRGTSSYWGATERAEHEQAIAVVRAQLDATTFAAAWEAGQIMTEEQAIAEALGEGAA